MNKNRGRGANEVVKKVRGSGIGEVVVKKRHAVSSRHRFCFPTSVLLFYLAFALLPLACFAGVGTTGGDLLQFGVSARLAAQASAGSARSGSIAFVTENPASLVEIRQQELLLTAEQLPEGLTYQGLAVARPTAQGVWGLTFRRLEYGTFTGRDGSGYLTESFRAGSWVAGVNLGIPLDPRVQFGFGVQYLSEQVADDLAIGWSVDLGLQGHVGAQGRWGIALLHVGRGLTFVQDLALLPTTLTVGVAVEGWGDWLTVQLEGRWPLRETPYLVGSVEGTLASLLSLRAGATTDPARESAWSLTAGLGLQVDSWGLDYAFLPMGRLGLTHQFSMLVRF